MSSTSRCSSLDALVCSSDLSPSAHLFRPPSECSLMSLSSSKEGVCPSGALGMAPWPSSLGVEGWGDERLHVCGGWFGGWVLFTLTSFELDQSHSLVVM